MSDLDHEKEFDKAFEGFGDDKQPEQPVDPPKDDPVQEDGGKDDTEPKEDKKPELEEPKEETPEPKEDDKEELKPTLKKEEEPKEETPEPNQPLTKEDVTSIISNMRTEERTSAKEVEETTKEVLDAYYPEGLSKTLTDTNGKELRTPQDVVEASGGDMTTEEAAQWLLNEQYKLDKQINEINESARAIAETTINFKRDSVTALQKYEPLFKEYPYLQKKVFDKLMKQVKHDKEKGVILSAPDVMEHYDDYLEPYQLAFEHTKNQPATNPTSPPEEKKPEPKPTADDRLDEGGDGGSTAPNDPNDFAQQVGKELAKGNM